MISPEIRELLRKLREKQAVYKPTTGILEQLQDVRFVCFVGAGGMGKTTLMDELVKLGPGKYGKTRNFTSRPPRPDDDPKRYYYYEHTDKGLKPLLDRIAAGQNLQHNIDAYSGYVYGSEIDDYSHSYNLGDIWSSSIAGFRQLGFGELRVFSVVTDPDSWQHRFDTRFPADHPLRQARLKEAAESLSWSLAQDSDDHAWVINQDGKAGEAAKKIDHIVRGLKPAEQNEARQLAATCLKRAKELLA